MIISTIIPVYNASLFLDKCINSLLNAQIDGVANEIILVNDGSLDNSLAICERYAAEHRNVKVFSQTNQGPSAARNLGIEKSQGAYITFVDSDDYVAKDYFKVLLSATEDYPAADIIIFGYYKVHDDKRKNEFFSVDNFDKMIHDYQIKQLLLNTMENNFLLFPVNKLYRKKLITDGNSFPFNLRLGEDSIFNLSQFYNAQAIVFKEKSVYNYYNNPLSVTSVTYKPALTKQMEEHFQTKLNFYLSKVDLNNPRYFCDLAHINLEKTFYALLANSLARKDVKLVEELKSIRDTKLIEFGFENLNLKEIKKVQSRLILYLLKYRFYFLLKLLIKIKYD